MTDNEIIEHIKTNRNDKVLVTLYKNIPMIKKMVITNGGKMDDVEDIFQEALLVLCMNVKKNDFKLTSKLSTYLYSICQFMWKAELRKRNRTNIHFVDTIKDITSDENELHEQLEKEKQESLAENVYHSLEERCKQLLSLFYTKKIRMKEIAEMMGFSSEDSAKTQKYKCIEAARKNWNASQKTLQN